MLLERQKSICKDRKKTQTESRRVIVKTQAKVPSHSWRWQFQRQMLHFQRCCLLEPRSVPLGHSPPSPPGRRDNDPSGMSEEECGPGRPSTSRGCGGGSSALLLPPDPTSKNPGCTERESYPWKGLTPVMLIVMAISPQEMLHVPIKSFHLAVTLGMVPGYKSDVYIEQTTEGLPYLGDELQSSVWYNVLWESIKPKHILK